MTKIIINGNKEIEGFLTVNNSIQKIDGKEFIVHSGMLKTETYIKEDINSLKTKSEDIIVDGVRVIEESFGSEDKDIIYAFTAKKIIINR